MFFGRTRGRDFQQKVIVLQGAHLDTINKVLTQLYAVLSILDNKAMGLLTANALFIAAFTALLIAKPEDFEHAIGIGGPPTILRWQLGALGLSSVLCLLVVHVTWRFMAFVPAAAAAAPDFDDEVRQLTNVIDDRTRYYGLAWLLSIEGLILTAAWWWPPPLVAALAIGVPAWIYGTSNR